MFRFLSGLSTVIEWEKIFKWLENNLIIKVFVLFCFLFELFVFPLLQL